MKYEPVIISLLMFTPLQKENKNIHVRYHFQITLSPTKIFAAGAILN